MIERLTAISKKIAFRSGIVKTRYDLLLTPLVVHELMGSVVRGEAISGDVIEIGVARGKTTVLLNTLLDELNSKKAYFAVDTFSGFQASDVEFEQAERGKTSSYRDFGYNDVNMWKKVVVESNSFTRIKIVASDIKTVEFEENTRFSTALIDVDLYKPTLAALEKIVPLMSPGGSIILDDMEGNNRWDGARAAFEEFTKTNPATNWSWIGADGAVIHC